MNYKQFNIGVPIKDNNVKIVSGLTQGDTANIVNVRLVDGTKPFDYTGYTDIVINILKPDGKVVVIGITSDPSNPANKVNIDNKYNVQAVDPAEGRIEFTLTGQATNVTGTYFCSISLFSGGKVLTTARINYYVGETLASETDGAVQQSEDYINLLELVNRNSAIETAEKNRADAEALRMKSEEERVAIFNTLHYNITEYLKNAENIVNITQGYMKEAERFSKLAQNPSKDALQSVITELNLAPKEYVDGGIADATKDFIVGDITELAPNRKKLTIGTSTNNASDIANLDKGETCVSADGVPVIGTDGGNVMMGGVVVGATEPTFTNVLWIDTANGNQLKFYDGTWKPASIVAFS